METIINNNSKGIRSLFFLIIILGLFFSYEMGNRPFASPDEGRYVEIPREMVVNGDYVTPRLNDLKYFEKPPLFYWLQSAVIKSVGITENSMRFIPVLFAILGCLMLFLVGTKCYSLQVGILSAGILATSLIYYVHSHLIILDLVMTVLLSGCLFSFFLAFAKKNSLQRYRKSLLICAYAFSALACLTKGLIGIVLPTMVCFIWMVFTNNWRILKEIIYIPGILIFLAIFLPWHIIVAHRNDDFLHFYFIVEHFLRYTSTIHNRYQPFWFFIPVIIIGMLPWTGFSLVALKNLLKNKNSESVFFLSWILGIFIFFSLSNSKLIPYILPIIPPFALITASWFSTLDFRDLYLGVIINILLLLSLIASYFFAYNLVCDVVENQETKILIYFIMGLLFSIMIVQFLAIFKKISPIFMVILCIFLSGNMLWTINKLAPYYQDVKKPTTCDVAKAIRMNKTKEDLVFCYNQYYQDFPVYLNDTIGVVNFVGELEFGANSEPYRSKLVKENDFWHLWNTTNKRIFLLLSRNNYREIFVKRTNIHRILSFDKNFIAITNK